MRWWLDCLWLETGGARGRCGDWPGGRVEEAAEVIADDAGEKGEAATVERSWMVVGRGEEEGGPFVEVEGGQGGGGAEGVKGAED